MEIPNEALKHTRYKMLLRPKVIDVNCLQCHILKLVDSQMVIAFMLIHVVATNALQASLQDFPSLAHLFTIDGHQPCLAPDPRMSDLM